MIALLLLLLACVFLVAAALLCILLLVEYSTVSEWAYRAVPWASAVVFVLGIILAFACILYMLNELAGGAR
jgi:hypothetical protein